MKKIMLYKIKKFLLNGYNYYYFKDLGFMMRGTDELILLNMDDFSRLYTDVHSKYISCEDRKTLIEFNIKRSKIDKLRIYDKSNYNYKLVYDNTKKDTK